MPNASKSVTVVGSGLKVFVSCQSCPMAMRMGWRCSLMPALARSASQRDVERLAAWMAEELHALELPLIVFQHEIGDAEGEHERFTACGVHAHQEIRLGRLLGA